MATDLRVSVKRQIERLEKELAVATGRVAELQEEIKRHELVYDMLDGRKTGKRFPAGSFRGWSVETGAARRDDRLDGGSSRHYPPSSLWKPWAVTKRRARNREAYHRQVVARWSKEGRIRRTGRGMYEKT